MSALVTKWISNTEKIFKKRLTVHCSIAVFTPIHGNDDNIARRHWKANYDCWDQWYIWSMKCVTLVTHTPSVVIRFARHAGNNRTRYIDKADWFSYKTKHQSATVFYKYLFRPTKATEATGPQAVERRGLKFAVIYLSFWRIMAEERKVLLALDGSANSEYALNCKYKIALFNISTCVSSALCR